MQTAALEREEETPVSQAAVFIHLGLQVPAHPQTVKPALCTACSTQALFSGIPPYLMCAYIPLQHSLLDRKYK